MKQGSLVTSLESVPTCLPSVSTQRHIPRRHCMRRKLPFLQQTGFSRASAITSDVCAQSETFQTFTLYKYEEVSISIIDIIHLIFYVLSMVSILNDNNLRMS